MSTVMVITPILVANWSAITTAITAAAAAMGFATIGDCRLSSSIQSAHREQMEVEDSEILETAVGTAEEIVVEREGVRATFCRDARGALLLCMEGEEMSKPQLRKLGNELIGRMRQQYAYHRLVTELRRRNMTIVDERMTEDQTVQIRVRNW